MDQSENQVKFHELQVLAYLVRNKVPVEHDSTPDELVRVGLEYRPDFTLRFDGFVVLLEIDENDHDIYDLDKEVTRMVDIIHAFSHQAMFVRFGVCRGKSLTTFDIDSIYKKILSHTQAVSQNMANPVLDIIGYQVSNAQKLYDAFWGVYAPPDPNVSIKQALSDVETLMNEDLECRRCGYKTNRKWYLISHLQRKKTCKALDASKDIDREDLLRDIKNAKVLFRCRFCEQPFNSHVAVHRHMKKCAHAPGVKPDIKALIKQIKCLELKFAQMEKTLLEITRSNIEK